MTDKGPRTAEGRALLEWLDGIGDSPLSGVSFPDADDRILAIEGAAYRQGIAAARAAVEEVRDAEAARGKPQRPNWATALLDKLAALDSTDA